jgi:transposase-like protein
VDKAGRTVDFLLSRRRDMVARFFQGSKQHGASRVITLDGYAASHQAEAGPPSTLIARKSRRMASGIWRSISDRSKGWGRLICSSRRNLRRYGLNHPLKFSKYRRVSLTRTVLRQRFLRK